MRRFLLILTFIFIIFFLGRSLNPFNNKMFTFHDETQAARINQFVLNLNNLKIPPRIAPDFSFKLGFPVFNYYAPFPYWLTSSFHLVGISIINSLKISFLLAIILSFISMYLFTSQFFGFFPSLLSGALYASSPWLAVEIFIRGNLAEIWFIALLPLSFWAVYINQKNKSRWFFVLTSLILGFVFTSHNVLSIVFIPAILIFILLLKNKNRNLLSLLFAFLINAYYFIPAILEVGATNAILIVKHAHYSQNLLCLWQLWTTPFWGYGGSGPGCTDDGMSFMLGKPQIILGSIGLIFLIIKIIKERKNRLPLFFIILLFFSSVYFVTYLSLPISLFFEKYLLFFQFPWRLLVFSLFGMSFFIAALNIPNKFKKLEIFFVLLSIMVIVYNSKFFIKHTMTNKKFNQDFLSSLYINKMVSYKIAEYLPITVNYKKWLELEPTTTGKEKIEVNLIDNQFIHSLDKEKISILYDQPFYKKASTSSRKVLINVSYSPYWEITVNNQKIIPKNLDYLGRPILDINSPSIITVKYEQTTIEKVGNFVSIITFIGLILFVKLFYG